MSKDKKKYYGYFLIDKNVKGTTDSWDSCKNITAGNSSRYKSFPSLKEAEEWLDSGAKYAPNPELAVKKMEKKKKNLALRNSLEEGIYFDAGTGRKIGVEVRVTNLAGESYLDIYFPEKVNEFGNINLGKECTNNYGELVGLFCALKIAMKINVKKIFGDSNLVLFYWSQGRANREGLNPDTVKLIDTVTKIRKDYEKIGGVISFVSGDINPADLGFHK